MTPAGGRRPALREGFQAGPLLMRAGHVTRTVGRAAQSLVGCGRALIGEQIAIVEPDRRTRLAYHLVSHPRDNLIRGS